MTHSKEDIAAAIFLQIPFACNGQKTAISVNGETHIVTRREHGFAVLELRHDTVTFINDPMIAAAGHVARMEELEQDHAWYADREFRQLQYKY